MRTQTFAWLMLLYGVIAFCCVQETARQARWQYRLAGARRQEEDLRRRLEDAQAEEQRWVAAARLLAANEHRAAPLVPLAPLAPPSPAPSAATWPGDIPPAP